MKLNRIVFVAGAVLFLFCAGLWAGPTTAYDAEMVVSGWFKAGVEPMGMNLGRRVSRVETFSGAGGRAAYHIVHLEPSGFVIVSGDDKVEPIIGFADDGTYDSSPDNPLGALVTNDVSGRVEAAGETFGLLAMTPGAAAPDSPQGKWRYFIDLAENPADGFSLMSLICISDIRVVPLVQSRWGQATACGEYTFNYYTPENYPCGCMATVLAQVMRYYEYPTAQIGVNEFTIDVHGAGGQTVHTRGGEGLGGPYNWSDMPLRPEANCAALTETQRQAIGTLCYDAGIAVGMEYTPSGSGSFLADAKDALVTTFQFENAVLGYNATADIHAGLTDMINPNLDAGAPVILAILNASNEDDAHAVVCDGYGFDSSTLYHHLNMGWVGIDDVWYNLPDIDGLRGQYSTVFGCIYNISPSGTGEIVSGRVLDPDGMPIVNARVFAEPSGRIPVMARSNDRGIYVFENLNSNTVYTLEPEADGYVFSSVGVEVDVLRSEDGTARSGNRWGVDIYAEQVLSEPRARLVYVDDDTGGDPAEDGSAEHPFDTIQEAIDAAVSGDTVVILSGTYAGAGNRDLDFRGKAITVRSEDPNDPGLVIIDCDGTADDPHRGFNFHSYETPRSILDGLTITDGYHAQGGGINFSDCAGPTVTNCTFRDNRASLGGGVYAESGPTLTNCTFSNNSADGGGGLYNNGDATDCNPVLSDCTFVGNAATNNGGGMYNLGPRAKPVLTNCQFIGNSVSEGGGGAVRSNVSASPTFVNCLFAGNSAATFGGAIRNSNGGTTELTNCTFGNNSAPNGTACAATPDDADRQSPCVLAVVNCIARDGGDEIYNDDGSVIDVTFSNIQQAGARVTVPGEGNINADPYFADPDGGDFHLKSEAGRWHSDTQSWIRDETTSPCIDAGDATMALGAEPAPNGGVINMGAYGGTVRASKSL
ncbi:MAG: C10 family peptidase [Planctomycetota bacterium]|jgi:parallel beta-helix repeat protein